MASQGNYVFSQQPKAVQARKKYRDVIDPRKTNLMNDRRVVRGNTYAARPLIPAEETQKRLSSTRFANTRLYSNQGRSSSRRSKKVEVEEEKAPHEWLEELTDIPLSEDFSAQTDAGDELANVKFVPKPSGTNIGTHMDELELFDFDSSVQPILEVIIGKSMDQGLLEVIQEEELKLLKAHRVNWEMRRNLIHNEAQRLLVEAQRQKEETDRRLAQAKEAEMQAKIEAHRLKARSTAKEFFAGLQNSVLQRLAEANHFYDPVENQVKHSFVPWLMDKIASNLLVEYRARDEVDNLLKKTIDNMKERVVVATREREERKLRELKEEEERLRLEEEERKQRKEEERLRRELEKAEGEGDEDEDEDY